MKYTNKYKDKSFINHIITIKFMNIIKNINNNLLFSFKIRYIFDKKA